MKIKELKDLKKADWQEIAKNHGVEFEAKSTVRYLCEKVAEIIGVDDKIVKDSDMKKAVYDKLTEIKPVKEVKTVKSKAKKEVNKEEKPKAKTKKTSTKKDSKKKSADKEVKEEVSNLSEETIAVMMKSHYMAQATSLGVQFGHQQSASDIKQALDYHVKQNPHVSYEEFNAIASANKESAPKEEPSVDNELAEMQKQCRELGLAFAPAHTAQDLKQLITAVKGSGQSVNVNPNAPVVPVVAEKTVEATATPADPNSIGQQVAPVPAFLQGAGQPVQTSPQVVQHNATAHANDVSEVDESQLKGYRGAIMSVIQGHFRAMTRAEITHALTSSKYPFAWEMKTNPNNAMQIAITLTSKGNTVRLPNDDKGSWINIGG